MTDLAIQFDCDSETKDIQYAHVQADLRLRWVLMSFYHGFIRQLACGQKYFIIHSVIL